MRTWTSGAFVVLLALGSAGAWSFETDVTKSSPLPGAVEQPTSLWLQWVGIGGAATYEYCVDAVNDDECTAPATWISTAGGTSVEPTGLAPGTTYYWQVRSNPGPVYADGGTWWAFTTMALPGAFSKILPLNGRWASMNPVFSWGASTGAARYEICTDITNDDACGTFWNVLGTAQRVRFVNAPIGTTYYWQVRAANDGGSVDADAGAWWRVTIRRTPSDEDRDGLADQVVWRAPTGTWHVLRSKTLTMSVVQWGSEASGDQPVPGDYDGDGRMDLAVWRPANGTWYVLPSISLPASLQWGNSAAGDVPVPADYDGDGKTDVAVWRASTGYWYVLGSGGGTITERWGSDAHGDQPVPADYDGDGRADLAVWRPATGTWYIRQSVNGQTITRAWGSAALGDKVLPADYDGDNLADLAVWRATTGTWYIRRSTGGTITVQWGAPTDVPMPSDYDGDGRTDLAVWRPGNGLWYIVRSWSATPVVVPFGLGAAGDIPVRER